MNEQDTKAFEDWLKQNYDPEATTRYEVWQACCEAKNEQLAVKDAVIANLKEALEEFDALIKHQYSGTREAMSDMTYAAQRGVKSLALTNDDSALQEALKKAKREALLAAYNNITATGSFYFDVVLIKMIEEIK